ncbi:KAP family P-loop domain protein [compost metagenome]
MKNVLKTNQTNSLFNSITVKEGIKYLAIILIYLLAYDYIHSLFSEYIVGKVIEKLYNPFLSLFELLVFSLLSILILIVLFTSVWKTNYKIDKLSMYLILLITCTYIYERFVTQRYSFTLLVDCNLIDAVAVLDIIFSLLFISLIVFISNHFQTLRKSADSDSPSQLSLANPLKALEEDEYGRNSIYNALINKISCFKINKERSVVIGIVNEWGDGKTSFLNFLESKFENKENIDVIKFYPWFNAHSDNLIVDFFKLLDKTLSKYIHTGSLLRDYTGNLTQINSVYNFTKYLPQAWLNNGSNEDYFNNIKERILNTDRLYYVLIDDLDRLDAKEVFNVFRLVRTSANFPNLVFIISFDKEYILAALGEIKIPKPEQYIKKIFDLEVSLPPVFTETVSDILYTHIDRLITSVIVVPNDQMRLTLKRQNDEIFKFDGLAFRVESDLNKYSIISNFIRHEMRNKRDIIRLANALEVSFSSKHLTTTYFPDLFIIELIKFSDIGIYYKLFQNRNYLIDIEVEGGRKGYRLYQDTDISKEDPIFSFMQSRDLYDILSFRKKDDKKHVDLLIKALFAIPEKTDYNSHLSIFYASNYFDYFKDHVEELSYDKLDKYLHGSYEIKFESIKDEQLPELLDKLNSFIIGYKDEGFQKLLVALGIIMERYVDDKYLTVYSAYKKILEENLPKILEDERSFEDFKITYLDSLQAPYLRIASINKDFVLEIQDRKLSNRYKSNSLDLSKFAFFLKETNIALLEKAIDEKLAYEIVMGLFYQCVDAVNRESNKIILIRDAFDIIRKYIEVNQEAYLENYLRPYWTSTSSKDNLEYCIHKGAPFAKQIFEDEVSFFSFLMLAPQNGVDNDLVEDLKKFFYESGESANFDKQVILYNYDSPNDEYGYYNDVKRLKLNSRKHKNVRPECLPN